MSRTALTRAMPGTGSGPSYRSRCDACGTRLEPHDAALGCASGTTYCARCARASGWVCPECAGELVRRPRPAETRTARSARTSRPGPTVTIRRAQPADLPELSRLFDDYRRFYGESSDRDGARRFLRDRLHRDESVVFVARSAGRAVGFVQLYPSFSSTRMRRMWILNDLYVVPEGRRRGIGDRLLERAEHFVRETGSAGAWLETAVDNPAQRLYASRGWLLDREFLHFDWTVPKHRASAR